MFALAITNILIFNDTCLGPGTTPTASRFVGSSHGGFGCESTLHSLSYLLLTIEYILCVLCVMCYVCACYVCVCVCVCVCVYVCVCVCVYLFFYLSILFYFYTTRFLRKMS